jgi:hypothetical protein
MNPIEQVRERLDGGRKRADVEVVLDKASVLRDERNGGAS